MKKILIIGAGAMGSAFTIPCLDNNNKVTLSEPYNFKLLKKILSKKRFHPALKLNLPKKLTIKKFSSELLIDKWDLIVIAVSSVGINSVREAIDDFEMYQDIDNEIGEETPYNELPYLLIEVWCDGTCQSGYSTRKYTFKDNTELYIHEIMN